MGRAKAKVVPVPVGVVKQKGQDPKALAARLTVALRTWRDLNHAVKDAGEDLCLHLLTAEQRGRARRPFLLRIHARLNRVRAQRERQEMLA